MGFSRQEYWSGLPCPPPGDLPDPEIELISPALAGRFFAPEPPGKPLNHQGIPLSTSNSPAYSEEICCIKSYNGPHHPSFLVCFSRLKWESVATHCWEMKVPSWETFARWQNAVSTGYAKWNQRIEETCPVSPPWVTEISFFDLPVDFSAACLGQHYCWWRILNDQKWRPLCLSSPLFQKQPKGCWSKKIPKMCLVLGNQWCGGSFWQQLPHSENQAGPLG